MKRRAFPTTATGVAASTVSPSFLSGKPLFKAAGITVLKSSFNRMKAGSGRYQFTVSRN